MGSLYDLLAQQGKTLANLLPGGYVLSPEWQQNAIESVGNVVGPAVDLWSSDAPLQEKLLRSAGAVAETVGSVPSQLLAYSPEAEAAFIGPKGYANLQKKGLADKATEFASKFFGDRWEISPPLTTNVGWRMGDVNNSMDRVVQEAFAADKSAKKAVTTLSDLIPDHMYPDLYAAYPKLRGMPVEIVPRSKEIPLKAEYTPKGMTNPNNDAYTAIKLRDRLDREWRRQNPSPVFSEYTKGLKYRTPEYDAARAQYEADLKAWNIAYTGSERGWPEWGHEGPPEVKLRELMNLPEDMKTDNLFYDYGKAKELRAPGKIRVQLSDEMKGDYPGSQLAESLMHEVQHYIQGQEIAGGKTALKPAYDAETMKLTDKLASKIDSDRLLTAKAYHLNPYEREARDAAARDVMGPKDRIKFKRRTEKQ